MHKLPVLGCLTLLFIAPLAQSAESIDPVNPKRVSKDMDVSLTSEVKAALIDNGIARKGEVQVETHDGVVQLSGFVDSESTQELALRAAKNVEGVESVRNDLVVQPSTPTKTEAKEDTVVAAKVRKQLQQEPDLQSARDINVDVSDGIVQLSGFVANVEEKTRAADAVATVAGVRDVRNDIALAR
jgi:hyperosmotically inducible periplasmic protein